MAKQISDIPEAIQDRLDRTPAERKAELEARRQARLESMTPDQRQAAQERVDRINAVPTDKRPAFIQASRLAMVARSIHLQVTAGLKLDEALALLTSEEADAINWLADQLIAERSV
jgi:type II secretory pathway component PulF